MERALISPKVDPDLTKVLNGIFDDAVGSPIVLTSAPTTAGGELKVNQIGIFSDDLYWNINGTVIRFSGTAV